MKSKWSTGAYDQAFYRRQRDGALAAARRIIPILLRSYPVHSVCDLGCGVGSWLKAFDEFGISDIQGVDGDYVDRTMIEIPADRFRGHDLSKPLDLGRRFDLAVSLEVAEHLPPDAAPQFVATLVSLAPVVLFSAAIPFQGGRNHVNEQWQSFWANLFKQHNYVAIDCIRPEIWKDREIRVWYRQNCILYVYANTLKQHDTLLAEQKRRADNTLDIVHPDHYREESASRKSVGELAPIVIAALGKALRRRLTV